MNTHKHGNKKKLSIKKALINCKLVIRTRLVNNLNLNKKVVFIVLILSPTTVLKLWILQSVTRNFTVE